MNEVDVNDDTMIRICNFLSWGRIDTPLVMKSPCPWQNVSFSRNLLIVALWRTCVRNMLECFYLCCSEYEWPCVEYQSNARVIRPTPNVLSGINDLLGYPLSIRLRLVITSSFHHPSPGTCFRRSSCCQSISHMTRKFFSPCQFDNSTIQRSSLA